MLANAGEFKPIRLFSQAKSKQSKQLWPRGEFSYPRHIKDNPSPDQLNIHIPGREQRYTMKTGTSWAFRDVGGGYQWPCLGCMGRQF